MLLWRYVKIVLHTHGLSKGGTEQGLSIYMWLEKWHISLKLKKKECRVCKINGFLPAYVKCHVRVFEMSGGARVVPA